jgi:hypothetical protein
MAQEIYLSPRKILDHLKDIERNIPKRTFSIYKPSDWLTSANLEERLYLETTKMAEFAGLNGFQIDVKYEKLKENVGGNISLNNSSEKVIRINISDEFKGNVNATLAVLAHEICHKVLFVNGLYVPLELMNEVYTDLTTIYIGFGELITKGYCTISTNQAYHQRMVHLLGYLTPETYKVTNEMILSIFGHTTENQEYTDFYAEEAIKKWNKHEDKQSVIKTFFIEKEEQMAQLHRNILLLEGLLNQCKQDMAYDFDKTDESFYRVPFANTDKLTYPIAAFAAIYEMEFHQNSEYRSKLIQAIDSAIFSVYTTYQEGGNYEFKYDFSCPFCGTKGKNEKNVDKITVIKCPQCKRHYTFDVRTWNASKHQKKSDLEQREKKRKEQEEIEKLKRVLRQEEDHKLNLIKMQSLEKIKEIKANEEQRTKEKIIQQIPSWLRWIVKKYIV